MNIEAITLEECPAELQEAVQKKLSKYPNSELFSVRMVDCPIYKDSRKLLRTYTAYVLIGNTFFIFKYFADGFRSPLMEDSLTIGDMREIIDKSPEATGLRAEGRYGTTPIKVGDKYANG